MPKICRLGRFKIELLPLSITILTFIILISLGIWQIFRLQEKELFLSSIKNNLNNSPTNIETNSRNNFYAKIKVRGKFLTGKNLHLYGRRSMSTKKDGYYLITPFKTENNKIILVVRGWFNSNYKKNIDNMVENSSNINQIIGVVLPGENKRFFMIDNDIKNNIWFTLDISKASEVLNLKLERFYLTMYNEESEYSDILETLQIENLLQIRNNHLEYAATWFSLAISLIVIFVIYLKNHQRFFKVFK